MINYFNLSFKDLLRTFKYILSGKSFMRINHDMFLRNLSLRGNMANIGAGHNYKNFSKLLKSVNGKITNYDFYKLDENVIKIDLEKKFNLKKSKFDVIILFNVLEHIKNYKLLINSLKSSIDKNKSLEIFVPFMFRYHNDPYDYFRPTHFYLDQLLKDNGFKNKVTLIAAGPVYVVLEIIFRYLKFSFIKIFFLLIFFILDKVFKCFSKDYFNYYCGIHISCKRIK
jgi:hypothetical protein